MESIKEVDYKSMNVVITVNSVDLNTKIANVTVSTNRRKGVTFDNVFISGLLASKMINDKSAPYYEIGKKYSSSNDETFRKTNPFQFIVYERDGEQKTFLTTVEDSGRSKVYMGKDVFGNEMYENRFNPWKKKQYYRRFVDRTVTKEK